MMATSRRLLADDTCRETVRSWMDVGQRVVWKFKYFLPFDWHFCYRHMVDDHNNLHHAVPSIEGTWETQRWECRVFAFTLAVSEVNAFLIIRYFLWGGVKAKETLLQFQRKLVWLLIKNKCLCNNGNDLDDKPVRISSVHKLATAPPHAKWYRFWRWDCSAKCAYQQDKCTGGCGTRIWTYCVCTPGLWIYGSCHHKHDFRSKAEDEAENGIQLSREGRNLAYD